MILNEPTLLRKSGTGWYGFRLFRGVVSMPLKSFLLPGRSQQTLLRCRGANSHARRGDRVRSSVPLALPLEEPLAAGGMADDVSELSSDGYGDAGYERRAARCDGIESEGSAETRETVTAGRRSERAMTGGGHGPVEEQ